MSFACYGMPEFLPWYAARPSGPRRISRGMTDEATRDELERRAADDARLVRRVAEREQAALGELYDRFSRPLFSTAVHILKDAAEAEDIIHDVFLAVWEKASTFDFDRGSAFSWVVTLTRNRAIDRLRARRRRSEILEQAVPSDLGYDSPGSTGEAGAAPGSRDESAIVRAAVASLPPEQRKAVELAFFGGLTQLEISERLKEPLGTVKARIRRGLARLRGVLPHRL